MRVLLLLGILAAPLKGMCDSDTASARSLHAGIRLERAVDFYWYNGVTAEYSSLKLLRNKVGIGFNFLSSKLGTALGTNAIPFYEVDLSGAYYLRNGKALQPLFRLNAGYARSNYGSDIFNSIPNHAMILSAEAAVSYTFKVPLRISLGGGYNVFTGNGMGGLGVVYPVYGQLSVMYRIF